MKPGFLPCSSLLALLSWQAPALADPLPTRVGHCSKTRIVLMTGRLENDPESGVHIEFENKGTQVSYERDENALRSRIGDPVIMCLISIPKDCPPGDNRGKSYKTTNLRTKRSWTMTDTQHSCGGA